MTSLVALAATFHFSGIESISDIHFRYSLTEKKVFHFLLNFDKTGTYLQRHQIFISQVFTKHAISA